MMRHWDEILNEQRGPFYVVVSKTWEDLDPADCFDDTCWDIQDIYRKIDDCEMEWFMLRTQVFFEGVELASEYLGGCLYDDPQEVLRDGVAEDQIYQALIAARKEAEAMKAKFAGLDLSQVDDVVI